MILHIPTAVLSALRQTAAAAGVGFDVVAAVALDQFGRLPAVMRSGLMGEFRALATGPREPVELARLGTTSNGALAALWVFAELPAADRLALVEAGWR